MPWCPNCKLEYVEGIKICPDCKTALVDELSEEKTDLLSEDYPEGEMSRFGSGSCAACGSCEDSEPETDETAQQAIEEISKILRARGITDDEIKAIIENARRRSENSIPKYESVKDKSEENRSSAKVLIGCGGVGIIVIVLSLLNIIKLPFSGYSKWLTIGVMGLLFLVFLFSGIKSHLTYKRLIPEVEKEDKKIHEAVSILKGMVNEGSFDLANDTLSMEEQSLYLSEMAVMQLEKHLEDPAPGFSFYVVDRYYSDIFDTDDED